MSKDKEQKPEAPASPNYLCPEDASSMFPKLRSLSMHSHSPILYTNPNPDDDLQMSNLQYQRVLVDQLTRESGISRINVSVAIRDLMVSQKISIIVVPIKLTL